MTLHVFTAPYRAVDPDRLDITRAGADKAIRAKKPAPGEFLAPSARLVFPTLRALRAAKDEADREAIWSGYVAAYRNEIVGSYRQRRDDWDRLLARDRVVLVCFCRDPKRCHRTLAARMLEALGAVNAGELVLV